MRVTVVINETATQMVRERDGSDFGARLPLFTCSIGRERTGTFFSTQDAITNFVIVIVSSRCTGSVC